MSNIGKGDARKARYWQQMLGEAARSGLSIREFCRRRRLKESQFYWWQHRLRRVRPEGATAKPGAPEGVARFALVSEEAEASAVGIELVLGDGRKLRIRQGVDEATLRSVLAALEPPRC
jgi:transposase